MEERRPKKIGYVFMFSFFSDFFFIHIFIFFIFTKLDFGLFEIYRFTGEKEKIVFDYLK